MFGKRYWKTAHFLKEKKHIISISYKLDLFKSSKTQTNSKFFVSTSVACIEHERFFFYSKMECRTDNLNIERKIEMYNGQSERQSEYRTDNCNKKWKIGKKKQGKMFIANDTPKDHL